MGWSQSSHVDYGLPPVIMRLRVRPGRVAGGDDSRLPLVSAVRRFDNLSKSGRAANLPLWGTSITGVSNPVLLVYSHRPEVRERIMTAIGRRPAADVGRVDYLECSAVYEVMMATQARQADILILDGEAQPTGGIGVSRQIHLEADMVPPVVVVVRRADDRWLATWAGADEILVHPLDPVTAADCIAGLLRRRAGGLIPAVTDTRPR